MFLKRLLLLALIGFAFFATAGKLPVSVSYQPVVFRSGAGPISLVDRLTVGSKESLVQFERTDSLFRNWKISGVGYDGSASLFVSRERGAGWIIRSGEDSLKVLIARDFKNANDPRMISITTSFVSGLFILENNDPDCNSAFRVYSLKNSWDADVEYTGEYALYLSNSDPCEEGDWTAKTGKLKLPQKVLVMAVFTAVMTQNVRYLVNDILL